MDVHRLRDRVAASLSRAPRLAHDVGQIYTTPRIVRLLENAGAEAERLKDEYIGVEHLLIAIADERGGDAARILAELGIDPSRLDGGERAKLAEAIATRIAAKTPAGQRLSWDQTLAEARMAVQTAPRFRAVSEFARALDSASTYVPVPIPGP